ncbi:hypothetical protein KW834_03505 [Pseudomonas sp. PDM29]|uniref:hypothetical protein n=1 Tax=Pseudomonas sp. PDM29 TaxID=2854771 RepID=UPI001C4605FB|nr:hypothetical protein [Pseudomonas sp. PDM29]MBV7523472.1 hypothetical protein [Pseudomonas sp. PDM29]
MASTIISALPGIHGSLLGIGLSLFSVFAIYGYQKIQECLGEFDISLKESQELTKNVLCLVVSNRFIHPADERGYCREDLDAFIWKNLIPFFRSEKWHNTTGFDAVIEAHCGALLEVVELYYGSSPYVPNSLSIEDYKLPRLQQMKGTLWMVNYLWKTFEIDIRRLARICTAKGGRFSYCEDEFVRFFEGVDELGHRVLPAMASLVLLNEKYNVKFDLRRKCKCVLGFSAFVLIFGVVIPLVVGDYEGRYREVPIIWSYILLFLSFLPYVQTWFYFCLKMRTL